MRRVKVEIECGWHKAVKDEEVEAVGEFEVSLGRGRAKLVAVCADCFDAWMMPLQAALEAEPFADSVTEPRRRFKTDAVRTSPGSGRRPQSLPLECREPGCVAPRSGERYVAPTRSALGAHVAERHGKKLSDYDWS